MLEKPIPFLMKKELVASVGLAVWHCLTIGGYTTWLRTVPVAALQTRHIRFKPSVVDESGTFRSARSSAWIHEAIESAAQHGVGTDSRNDSSEASGTKALSPDDRFTSSCQLHVGNLDWTIPITKCEAMIRKVLEPNSNDSHFENIRMIVQFKPSTNRTRDIGKYFAGSAVLIFDSPVEALLAMDQLLHRQNELGQGGLLRVSRVVAPPSSLLPEPPLGLSPERIALRLERAASYARRRERVATATDAIITTIMELERNSHLFNSAVPLGVLQAAELDWLAAPPEIDPARGGGLHSESETNHIDSSSLNKDILSGRATRKRAAVEAFLVVLRDALLDWDHVDTNLRGSMLLDTARQKQLFVADLGCGAGNLALPLAWWLQHQRRDIDPYVSSGVLGIDINGFALQRLRDRTDRVIATGSVRLDRFPLVTTIQQDLLYLLSSDMTTEPEPRENCSLSFSDCLAVVSLHACGAASDLSIAAAVKCSLPFAVSPCCIGKVMTSRDTELTQPSRMPPLPSSVNRSAAPSGTIQYPRSKWLQTQITPDDYHLLAAAADYGGPSTNTDQDPDESARWIRSRLAKQIVEMDRLQWAEEHGYYVRMMELPRIGPHYSKRELLLGAPLHSLAAHRIARLSTCVANIL